MNLLLDTHAFLWWIDGVSIPTLADEAIRNPDNTIWLSAASAWEITIKAGLGKLRLPDRAARFVEAQRKVNGFGWFRSNRPPSIRCRTCPFTTAIHSTDC